MLAAPADGHTLLVTNSNVLAETPHVMKPPYDPLKDVKAVAVLAQARAMLLAGPEVPAKDMAGLVTYLKAAPAKYSFGSPGAGDLAARGGELLNRRLGVDMQHVPFSGSPAAMVAMMSGQITLNFNAVVASTQLVNAGKVVALGVAGASRVPSMPNVPTFSEQGFPEFADFSKLPRAGDVAQGAARGGREALRRHQEDRAVAPVQRQDRRARVRTAGACVQRAVRRDRDGRISTATVSSSAG
jgi:tripartite-type tricarboxylate transporter receptor subunit TctC